VWAWPYRAPLLASPCGHPCPCSFAAWAVAIAGTIAIYQYRRSQNAVTTFTPEERQKWNELRKAATASQAQAAADAAADPPPPVQGAKGTV
jgi:hypothetical protein